MLRCICAVWQNRYTIQAKRNVYDRLNIWSSAGRGNDYENDEIPTVNNAGTWKFGICFQKFFFPNISLILYFYHSDWYYWGFVIGTYFYLVLGIDFIFANRSSKVNRIERKRYMPNSYLVLWCNYGVVSQEFVLACRERGTSACRILRIILELSQMKIWEKLITFISLVLTVVSFSENEEWHQFKVSLMNRTLTLEILLEEFFYEKIFLQIVASC